MSSKLRIANVSYLNSSPFRSLKNLSQVEYIELPPAECARRLHEGEADLALIPLAENFNHGDYHLLPLGVAATDSVKSVLLFHNGELSKLRRIYIDVSTQTSVNLLRILLAEHFFVKTPGKTLKDVALYRLPAEQLPAELSGDEAILTIGDLALQLRGKYPLQLDLATAWQELSGLPFIFAAWAYRDRELIEPNLEQLSQTLLKGIQNRRVYAREFASEINYDLLAAEDYVEKHIEYQLAEKYFAGAREFLSRGVALNIFPELKFAEVDSELDTGEQALKIKAAPLMRYKLAANADLDDILDRAAKAKRLAITEAISLASQASLADLTLATEEQKQRRSLNESVSYIVDRNINYTNVCNVYCRFCAFYRAPESIAGRASHKSQGAYLLSKEEMGRKIEETIAAGGQQILLQGGLNPELGIEYYEDLFRWIKTKYNIKLHALSADELMHIAKVSSLTLDQVLDRLIAAGLNSLPGAGAELLVDRVRRRIARLKSNSQAWLDTHRAAHRKGLKSTCTMMFGVQESWEDRVLHLAKLRQLQDETFGFTAFITWPFQEENTKLEKGNTGVEEYLRVQAIARLFLDNIPHIQSSWVTMGPSIGQVALYFGADDFGSVMFEENVVSAAGTTFKMNSDYIERHIQAAGFSPWQRNMQYERLPG